MDDFEKLINASDLIEWIMETYPDWCVGDVRSIVDHVMDLPSAEPEIIRCKDCKYARLTSDGSCKYCDIWFPDDAEYMDGDYYCASAERKSNG